MASDLLWMHSFCPTCDRQTDGATYCSESCRLADYEGSSPQDLVSPSWSASSPTNVSGGRKFVLTAPYDFANAQPYGTTPTYYQNYNYTFGNGIASGSSNSHRHHHHCNNYNAASRRPSQSAASLGGTVYSSVAPTAAEATTSVTYHSVLSPSSSQSSISSLRSSNSSLDAVSALSALSAFATGRSASYASQYGTSSSSTTNKSSDRDLSELRKYASSLEQCRLKRQAPRRPSC